MPILKIHVDTRSVQQPVSGHTPSGWSCPRYGVFGLLVSLALISFGGLLSATAEAAGQQIFDGLNGSVLATAVGDDGTTYVGGNFTAFAPQTGGGAVLASTGSGALNRNFPPVVGDVYTVAADGLGGWYIGGKFTHVAGVARHNLAHITGTGDLDPTWNPGANFEVVALAISGGTVYAGGSFTAAGGGSGTTTRKYLAAFDSSGAMTAWDPGANSSVNALAVSGGTVYAGGFFTQVGGTANGAVAQYLARFDVSGAPGAPTGVTVTRGDASGTVTWTAPSDSGGSAILNYVLEVAPGPNYDSWAPATTSGDCLTLTCTVTGLTNGTRY